MSVIIVLWQMHKAKVLFDFKWILSGCLLSCLVKTYTILTRGFIELNLKVFHFYLSLVSVVEAKTTDFSSRESESEEFKNASLFGG
jgi:hypothetical protein